MAAFLAKRSNPTLAILVGGLLCGIFDITFAFLYYGMPGFKWEAVLHSVAAGLVGRTASVNGGMKTAALGLVLHFVVAFSAAAVYFIASRALKIMVQHAVIFGLLYGIVVFVFMNWIVLPHSALRSKLPQLTSALIIPVIGHMLLVGLPIALSVKKFAK